MNQQIDIESPFSFQDNKRPTLAKWSKPLIAAVCCAVLLTPAFAVNTSDICENLEVIAPPEESDSYYVFDFSEECRNIFLNDLEGPVSALPIAQALNDKFVRQCSFSNVLNITNIICEYVSVEEFQSLLNDIYGVFGVNLADKTGTIHICNIPHSKLLMMFEGLLNVLQKHHTVVSQWLAKITPIPGELSQETTENAGENVSR
jgi:hypothetical protein